MIYISYYTTPDDKRNSSPAANVKTYSIAKALVKNGIDVDILSTCTVAKEGQFIPGRKFKLEDRILCKQYALINTRFGPFRRMQYYLANVRVFLELLLHASRNDTVLFYHAIERSYPVLFAKQIKKFRLILEVEEIYTDVRKFPPKIEKAEWNCLRSADAYIFPTVLLNEKINIQKKPYALIHGTYQVERDRKCKIFCDGAQKGYQHKIHCVYAGTFDPQKGGAMAAAAAAEFLPENYHIHILGFGSDEEKSRMQKLVKELSAKSACTITYDGLLSGEAYIRFIQSCDIGLSTQNPDAAFNATSFPSKILSYMANGLRVVSIRIPAVEGSAIGEYMYYYDQQTPEEIAKAIMQVDIRDDYDGRKIISDLNSKFQNELSELLKNEITRN